MKTRRLQVVLALLVTVGCGQQPPAEVTVRRRVEPPPPESMGPGWAALYGTMCVFHEGPVAACPQSTSTPPEMVGYPGATVCCPASAEESVPPPVPAEPPWPPQPCLHTGIQECDAATAARYELWKRSTPEERAGWRHNLDLGCSAYRNAAITTGLGIEGVRQRCAGDLSSLDYALRTPPPKRAPPSSPAPLPAPLAKLEAIRTIARALERQLPPKLCTHTDDVCDAYLAAYYACWKRATPEVRSFLEPSLAVSCSVWSEMAALNGGTGMRADCQAALDATVEHPACKP